MGNRTGQIDPGVILLSAKGMSVAEGQEFLCRDCGLKGLSGVSNDMQELQNSGDPNAAFALDYFVYRAALQTGMLTAALKGLDGFVVIAGIGENSAGIPARIAERMEWLGVLLDPVENARHATRISRAHSRVPVYVMPTDEEFMIAQHTLSLLWNMHSFSSPERTL
jgi:acetate kinase